jgi:transcriptional regulator with XRE-family HTH domain
MRITTEHPSSTYGIPVVLDDAGNVMDYAEGVRAARASLGLSTAGLAEATGKSRRTVEGWEGKHRPPPAEALYVLAGLLAARPRPTMRETSACDPGGRGGS